MKVNSRWRAGPSLLFTNLQGNRKIMDRILSFSKIRKYNTPTVPLNQPQIQSGKFFLFSELFVVFLFYKCSLSKFRGIFNVLKLLFHFWPQLPLFLIPLKKLKPVLFLLLSLFRGSFFSSFVKGNTRSSYSSPWVSPLCPSFWPSQWNVHVFVSMCGTGQTKLRSQHCLLHGNSHHHHT